MLSVLAGIRGINPCSSQLPSAGGFNSNARRLLQLQGSRSLAFDTINQARTVVRTIFCREQAGLLRTAHAVRRGSQSRSTALRALRDWFRALRINYCYYSELKTTSRKEGFRVLVGIASDPFSNIYTSNRALLFDLVPLDRLVLPGYIPGRKKLWSKALEVRHHLSRLSLSSQWSSPMMSPPDVNSCVRLRRNAPITEKNQECPIPDEFGTQ
ncbi:hypothetical protein AVEN_103919-1 [Araneus ventricosus]|uniref:Uncharacterized protein n=1 Tax=Araneus ventricosus TaxID=182803 RepID=A0A4Y2NPA6_ARAVE|nr:hypothetical protein AVEN_103919-1 [Araneus ventricosus]